MFVVAGGVTLALMAMCFWAGWRLARARGREVLPWALVSGLLPGIGLLILALQRGAPTAAGYDAAAPADGAQPVRSVPLQPSHDERWGWLKLNDPDIMSAVERLRSFGPSAQLVLRDIYLPAENKQLLNQMVAQVANQAQHAIAVARHQQRAAEQPSRSVNGAGQHADLASYAMRPSAASSVAAPPAGGGQIPVSQSTVSQMPAVVAPPAPFTAPLLGPSFVNGHDTAAHRPDPAQVKQQGGTRGEVPAAAPVSATAAQSSADDTLASATAALTTALRDARVAPPAVLHETPAVDAPAVSDEPAARRSVPHHTSVVAADLGGASFLETYRGIHLFALMDGRVYVDKYLAVASIDLARQAVDYVAMRNDT